jgi:hypothetical protein
VTKLFESLVGVGGKLCVLEHADDSEIEAWRVLFVHFGIEPDAGMVLAFVEAFAEFSRCVSISFFFTKTSTVSRKSQLRTGF